MKISHMLRQLGTGSKPKDGLKQIGQHPLPRSQRLRIITPSETTLDLFLPLSKVTLSITARMRFGERNYQEKC